MESPRVPLEWLDEPRLRRSALTLVHTAVRAGWLASNPSLSERRAELMGRLQAIVDDPRTRSREKLRILRIFAEMARQDMHQAKAEQETHRD